jgi:hypothetical protein
MAFSAREETVRIEPGAVRRNICPPHPARCDVDLRASELLSNAGDRGWRGLGDVGVRAERGRSEQCAFAPCQRQAGKQQEHKKR